LGSVRSVADLTSGTAQQAGVTYILIDSPVGRVSW
jgi:hypothetical protein